MTPKIELRDVHKAFGTNRVLRGVDLAVMPGHSMAVIGGSGSGKSVTIKCVLGLVTPDSGDVLLDGRSVAARSRADREALLDGLGMLFQGSALFDSLRIWENVAFRRLRTHGREECRRLATEKLERVGLGGDLLDRFPAELSGGMQKRVGLARAIATDPSVIFFDEPTTGLDPIMADVINDLIRELVTDMGATAVTITHDMASVRKIADEVAMLHDGVIRWSGPVERMDEADDAHLAQFIRGDADGPIEAVR